MSLIRRAAKRDANEDDIVTALEEHGCTVQRVSQAGIPDLLVYVPALGETAFVEVKSRLNHESKARREKQEGFMRKWAAAGAPVYRVVTVDQAHEVARGRGHPVQFTSERR